MSSPALDLPDRSNWPPVSEWPRQLLLPFALIGVTAIILYWTPATSLTHQWWTDDDAGQGLLLFPLSLWLAWRSGLSEQTKPAMVWGILFLTAAILLRALGGLAAEVYTQRLALWLSALGVIVFFRGWQQVWRWWLPLSLIFLSIPLPDLVMNRLAMPLQFVASRMGTALMEWRNMPVTMQGNIITLVSPEDGETIRLFVAEACSGLRSLTALLALGLAIGGMYLATATGRIILLLLAIPVAILLNAIRVFLTGFLMYYVSKAFGDGFMHHSTGWGLFVVAFFVLLGLAALIRIGEARIGRSISHE